MAKTKSVKLVHLYQRMGIALLGIFASIYIAYQPDIEGGEFLFLLPLAYSVSHLIFPSVLRYGRNNPGMMVFNIVLFIRYILVPVSRSLSGYSGTVLGADPIPSSVNLGIWIILYELLVSFIVIQLFSKKIYIQKKVPKVIKHIQSKFVLLSFLVLALVVLVRYPYLLQRYSFIIISDGIEKLVTEITFTGMYLMLLDWAMIIIPMLLINRFSKKYQTSLKFKYILFSLLVILPNLTLFSNTSRISILVPAISWFVLLISIYPKHKKAITAFMATLLIISMSSITLYKQFGYITSNGAVDKTLTPAEVSHTLDVYFSGPYNMGLAVDMNDRFGTSIDLQTFVNDALYNIPFIGKNVDVHNITPTWFNYHIYNIYGWVDQIIPITGQAMAFVGVAFAPVTLAVVILLLMFFDSKIANENRLEFIYLWTFMAVFLGMVMMLNMNIIKPAFTNTVLPLLILFSINRRLALKEVTYRTARKVKLSN